MRKLSVGLGLGFAVAMGMALPGDDRAPFNDSITSQKLRAGLSFLASDEMRGRLTATPGNRMAAEYLRSRFQAMGLEGAGSEGSFFQPFELMTATLGKQNRLAVASQEGPTLRYHLRNDFYPMLFSPSGDVEAPVVFVGYGIQAPALGHSDYSANVEGKIVLAMDHEPGESDPQSPFDGVVASEAARALRKVLTAQQQGAAGFLLVSDVHNHSGEDRFSDSADRSWPDPPRRIRRFTLADWTRQVRIPAAQISTTVAKVLLRPSGKTLEQLGNLADRGGGGLLPLEGLRVELSTSVRQQTVADRNVVARLEGGDPSLKQEAVIICAHFDHNGADDRQVFNGADDDGSGTIGVVEVAAAFAAAARAGARPRRTLLFALWNSEERGLLGAWAYTRKPLWPLEKTVTVINLDMIGRNEEVPPEGGRRFRGLEVQTAESNRNAVNVMGYSYSSQPRPLIEGANDFFGLTLRFRYDDSPSNLVRRSDHWPFLQHRIPAIFFHTGLHPDYHTARDRPEKINYAKMEKIVRLVHQTAWQLAQQDSRPVFERTLWNDPVGAASNGIR